MRSLILIIIVSVNQMSCGPGVGQVHTEDHVKSLEPNSPFQEIVCSVKNYKPKSKNELQSMSARDLIDESIKLHPDSFDSYSHMAEYEDLIERFIREAGTESLPTISQYINSYDSQNKSYCQRLRFDQVSRFASDIDRFNFRLRGTKEGLETVEALERAVKRITTEEDEGNNKNENPTIFKFLRWLKGINLADRNVADTLSVHYKITLTDDELLAFTNYLILTDPTYPRWSETKFIKDHSNVNEAGNPSQVYVYDNSKRFHDAYLNFKKSNKK